MKRLLNKTVIVALALMLIGGTAFGIDFDTMQSSFGDFSDDIAQALPQASTTGLTWSDARVRGFPHFGVGLSFGIVTIPNDAFTDLAGPNGLDVDLPKAITDTNLGVPFPTYALDARVGIPFLPIDVGAKLGVLTPGMADSLGGDTAADYMLAGFDVRYPLLKGRLIIPAISVSAGYNYLSGGITTTIKDAANLTSINVGEDIDGLADDTTISATDPDLRLGWKTHSMDFKVQASQSLLIFTPYIGGAYTYGWSEAGGGVYSDIEITGAGGYSKDDVKDALDKAGYDVDLSNDGFTVLSGANGGAFRAFGGFSVNLLILKLDLNGQYNFNTQSLGGGINARIQL